MNVSLIRRNQRGSVPMAGGKQWLSSGDISYCGGPWTMRGKDYCFQATIPNFRKEKSSWATKESSQLGSPSQSVLSRWLLIKCATTNLR